VRHFIAEKNRVDPFLKKSLDSAVVIDIIILYNNHIYTDHHQHGGWFSHAWSRRAYLFRRNGGQPDGDSGC